MVSLSSIATTYLEKERGFWAAYLLPTAFLGVAVMLMLLGHSKFGTNLFPPLRKDANDSAIPVKQPPQSNVLKDAAKVVACATKNRFQLDAAEPQYQLEHHGKVVTWDSHFVAEIKRGFVACKVL